MAGSSGSPTIASSTIPPTARSAAESQLAKPDAYRARYEVTVARARSAASPYRASPVSAARRRRTSVAIEPPDGVALSWGSFGRVTSAS